MYKIWKYTISKLQNSGYNQPLSHPTHKAAFLFGKSPSRLSVSTLTNRLQSLESINPLNDVSHRSIRGIPDGSTAYRNAYRTLVDLWMWVLHDFPLTLFVMEPKKTVNLASVLPPIEGAGEGIHWRSIALDGEKINKWGYKEKRRQYYNMVCRRANVPLIYLNYCTPSRSGNQLRYLILFLAVRSLRGRSALLSCFASASYTD